LQNIVSNSAILLFARTYPHGAELKNQRITAKCFHSFFSSESYVAFLPVLCFFYKASKHLDTTCFLRGLMIPDSQKTKNKTRPIEDTSSFSLEQHI